MVMISVHNTNAADKCSEPCERPTRLLSAETNRYDQLLGLDEGEEDEELPFGAKELDPRQGVRDWRITAVGHKPAYHVARDCLYGSLFRSPLPAWFHNYVKSPPPWITELTEHLPAKDRAQANQHIALHFLHLRRLSLLAQLDPADHPSLRLEELIPRLWRCWPYGVGVDWCGQGERSERDVCGLAWLCPWCFARLAVRAHQELLSGPLQHREGKYLLQGRVVVPGVMVDPMKGQWVEVDGRQVRKRVGDRLVATARALGVHGGILTFRIGQDWGREGERFFQYELGILGEVSPHSVARLRQDFEKTLDEEYVSAGGARAALGEGLAEMWPTFETWVTAGPVEEPVGWSLLPARDKKNPNVVRLLLAGSSANYPLSENLGLWIGHYPSLGPHFRFTDGLPGVLGWQPTFLLNDAQWPIYAAMTRGMPIYRTFGSWRDSNKDENKKKPNKAALSSAGKRPRRGDRATLATVNVIRQQAAKDRQKELIQVAQELWPMVEARCSGLRGRPPYRAVLGELLKENGYTVAERTLKQVMKSLCCSREQDG
jgi:hypothetical protein